MKKHITTCDNCGWTSKPTTEGRAAHALRIHSCDLHRTRQERAARVAARKAYSGPERPCTCKNTHHEHGNRLRYVVDKCRCRPCTDANNVAHRERERQKIYGRYDRLVDAEPVRTHIRELMASGMGWKRIARAAGISPSTVYPILYGRPNRPPRIRVQRHVAGALLAVNVDLADGARVSSVGAARRVQALVALGWSQSKLATKLGILPSNVVPIVRGRRDITVAHDKAIRALYDELWNQAPPESTHGDKIAASRARTLARTNRWVTPLAWDDDTIDDPAATPDLGQVVAINRGPAKLPPPEDVAWLVEQGESFDAIADRFGVTRNAVEQAIHRAGRTAA